MDEQFGQPAAVPAPSRNRRLIIGLLIAVLALLLLGGGVAIYAQNALFRPVTLAAPQTVEIRPRATLGFVAARLQQRGLIPSAFALRVYARLTGQANQLKVGEYEVTGTPRPVDILILLNSGRAKFFVLTVPEGKWASEVPAFVREHWPDAASALPPLLNDTARWRGVAPIPPQATSLEGFLFPDSYRFVAGVPAEKICAAMLTRFNQTCGAAYQKHPPTDGRSLYEVLILASLVEAEAKVPAERPIIAGVYMNRLRIGMPLQCDATVLYAKQQRLTRVLFRDLEVASPYNTYPNTRYRDGLPPGPICNPGLSCFEAALHPAKTDYLYYRTRGADGSHVFSRTMAEHEAAAP